MIQPLTWATDYLFNLHAITKINELVGEVNTIANGTVFNVSGSVANGEYLTDAMDSKFSFNELSYIRFFDASGNQVTPTGGTYKLMGTADGVNYLDITNSESAVTHNASDAYNPQRQRPSGVGLMVKAKIVLSGITGTATTFQAVVWRK